MKTIEINGNHYTIEELNAIINSAKNRKPIDEVYKYHGTSEENFNEKHKNSSEFIKAIDREALIVQYYNKSEKVDFDNKNQKKFYPFFKMDSKDFRFYGCRYDSEDSSVPISLCFLRKEDLLDAVEKFLPEYKLSRLNQ